MMLQKAYQNFELEFVRLGERYRLKARSPAGEISFTIDPPANNKTAQAAILKLERMVLKGQNDLNAMKQLGGILSDSVFQGEVRALFKSSLDLAERNSDSGLRLRLRLQETPELAGLPWECMYDALNGEFIALNRATPIVRYLELPKPIQPLSVALPLRVLVAIANPLKVFSLNVEEEKVKLQQALAELQQGSLQVDVLEAATVGLLQEALRHGGYHVFHFIGHGDFDVEADQGWLAFEDGEGVLDRVNADQLAAVLINAGTLRLIVINGCKTARTSVTNPFSGTATTLTRHGIPAVIAMQFSITDPAAAQLTGVFYGAIAEGLPVDAAITEARVALFSGSNQMEWATPVLFMRSPDGALFELPKGENNSEEKTRTQVFHKKKVQLRPAYIAISTLAFALLGILIFTFAKVGTAVELQAYAKQIKFHLSPKIRAGESVSLLHSGTWTTALRIRSFQTVEFLVDPTVTARQLQPFANPLRIVPQSSHATLLLSSPAADISVQEVLCDSGSAITYRRDEGSLTFIVKNSARAPQQRFSLGEIITIAVQNCRVEDGSGRELSSLFSEPQAIRLHRRARSLVITGADDAMDLEIAREQLSVEFSAQLLLELFVESVDFAEIIFSNVAPLRRSTVDSLLVKRQFPLDDRVFSSVAAGDLEIAAAPNQFVIYGLAETPHNLRLRAQGVLKSLKIGQGALQEELIPGFLTLVKENPLVSTLLAFLAWVLTALLPALVGLLMARRSAEE